MKKLSLPKISISRPIQMIIQIINFLKVFVIQFNDLQSIIEKMTKKTKEEKNNES